MKKWGNLLVGAILVGIIVLLPTTLSPKEAPRCLKLTQKDSEGCIYPNLPTDNPLVFGPHIWTALHMIANGYCGKNAEACHPTVPFIYQYHARRFIEAIPFLLPCGECGRHFNEFIKKQNLEESIRTKDGLIKFFVDAHNNVTMHINALKKGPPKKLWTVEEAKIKYSCDRACIHNKAKWEDAPDILTDIRDNCPNYRDSIRCPHHDHSYCTNNSGPSCKHVHSKQN